MLKKRKKKSLASAGIETADSSPNGLIPISLTLTQLHKHFMISDNCSFIYTVVYLTL